MQHSIKMLKNGMRVVTIPMKDTKSLTLLVLFGTGSKYEIKRINGISHFLEHMFFKGTKSRPRPGEVSETLDNVGAEHNAFTSKEYTGYWVKASSGQFDLAIDVVSDILLEPLFKEDEIKKERGVIFQEMSMYLDSPRRRVHDVFEELLYGDQPAGRDIIGTKKSLSRLTRKDFIQYWQNQYVGSNAVAVLAGNFNEKKASDTIKKLFSPLKTGSPCKKLKVREAQKLPHVRIEYKDTDQTHLVIGTRAFDMYDKRRYALSLLATILGGKTSSRLFQEIREERGLAYTISAFTEHYTDSGYFSVYAGVPHGKTKEVIRRVADAFRKICVEGIPPNELQHAKDFYRGQFAISLESSDETASFFGMQELFRERITTPEELMKKIDAVTVKDVREVAKTIFISSKMNAAIIGPHKNKTMEFVSLLNI